MLLELIKSNPAAIVVIVAALGWFLTRRGQIHSDRAKHSHSYVGILEKTDIGQHLKKIGRLLDKGDTYEEEKHNIEERTAFEAAIWECLQIMEKSAIDIDMGYISESYFKKKYKTFTIRFFYVSYKYISKKRGEKNSGSMYRNFEILYLRTNYSINPITLSLVEYLGVCPNFRSSSTIFAAHLRTKGGSFLDFVREILRFKHLPGKINYVGSDDRPLFRKRLKQLQLCELVVFLVVAIILFSPIS